MKSNTTPDDCGDHLDKLLLSQSRALVIAANGLASIDIPLDDAISLVLAMLQNPPEEAISGGDLTTRLDPQRLLLLAVGISKISGRSIGSLMQRIFETHPGVPSEFNFRKPFITQALNSFDQVIAHRKESGNVLLISEFVVEDVARGAAFYSVKSQDGTEGTISLRLGGSDKYPQVQVEQVAGANNADASPKLIELAQSLADSWATAQQLDCWVGYARQCAEWLRLASHSASQLSQ